MQNFLPIFSYSIVYVWENLPLCYDKYRKLALKLLITNHKTYILNNVYAFFLKPLNSDFPVTGIEGPLGYNQSTWHDVQEECNLLCIDSKTGLYNEGHCEYQMALKHFIETYIIIHWTFVPLYSSHYNHSAGWMWQTNFNHGTMYFRKQKKTTALNIATNI
jgi:hypothetical protein